MNDIVISPNPLLLEKCKACEKSDKTLKEIASNMQEIMYKYNGIGLAGPQIGILKQIIVVDIDYDIDNKKETINPIILINPKIIYKSDNIVESNEGCLSCPGVSASVSRHETIKVKYFDLKWKEHTIEANQLLSFCLQHEIDHLEGKTIFQTCKLEDRFKLLQEYNKCLENNIKPGEIIEDND